MSAVEDSLLSKIEQGVDPTEVLDDFLGQWYAIVLGDKKKLIDRYLVPYGAYPLPAKYILDEKVGETGNVFIETYSAVERNRTGWVWRSDAEVVIYFALPDTIYMAYMKNIRGSMRRWEREYGEVKVKGSPWTRAGVLVPESEFEMMCHKVRRLT